MGILVYHRSYRQAGQGEGVFVIALLKDSTSCHQFSSGLNIRDRAVLSLVPDREQTRGDYPDQRYLKV